ncbi:hypothetical protein [Aurantimonas sp. A3-2-R12]|uniref:hypothetical protein n=1 Tax=Aurantimonas sp. A3-2-R12 TaxID=3114362 RepID=UPI003FA49517
MPSSSASSTSAQGVDALDLGLKLPKPLIHVIGQFLGAVVPLRQRVIFLLRGGVTVTTR